jgi:K(+)-stimulated pyrophosphate-energized sodium pump
METLFFAAPVAGLIALIFAYYLVTKINKVDPGNEKMREIASAIHEGAMAFLNREYKVLVVFIIILAAIIAITGFVTEGEESMQPTTAVAFVIGAICSILAGNFGMRVATKANVRTANAAAQKGMNKALEVAFSGGAVMGMSVNKLGLILSFQAQLTVTHQNQFIHE